LVDKVPGRTGDVPNTYPFTGLETARARGDQHEAADGLRDLERLAEAALRDSWRKKRLGERDAVMRVIDADK
jgi:hypothetical protein